MKLSPLTQKKGDGVKTVVATGELSYNFINMLVNKVKIGYNTNIEVVKIKNNFFGGQVSVSGLICGADLIDQLKDKEFDRLLITKSMLKADEDIFLDDVTAGDVEKVLGCKIVANENNGFDFLDKLMGEE